MFKKTILMISLAVASLPAYAQFGCCYPTPCCKPVMCCPSSSFWRNFSFGVEGGYSISLETNFIPDFSDATPYQVSPPGFTWVPVSGPEGPDDFHTSPFWGVNIGYNITPAFSLKVDYSQRSKFNWERVDHEDAFQSGINIGERWRVDDISIRTLMFDVNLMPVVCWCGVRPFAEAGVGVAWNRLENLINNDIPSPDGTIPQTFNGVLSGKHRSDFAWNIGAGVDYSYCSNLHFQMGYRFVDVGHVETGNHLEDPTFGLPPNRSHVIQRFKAEHVQLSEVYVGLTYHLG